MVHPERAPSAVAFDSGSYEALAHTRAWVWPQQHRLATDPTSRRSRLTPKVTSPSPAIPAGTYQLVIWDALPRQIISYQTVTLAGPNQTLAVGNIPVPTWFGRHEHNVFLDLNGTASVTTARWGFRTRS